MECVVGCGGYGCVAGSGAVDFDEFMMMMGQLQNVPPEFVSWWLVIALALLGAAATGVTLWSNLRQRPPHEAPTRREFDGLVAQITDVERTLPLMERRIMATIGDERGIARTANGKLHARIDKVIEQLAHIAGVQSQQNETLRLLLEKQTNQK